MTPRIPEPYIPFSYRDLQTQLSEALVNHIDRAGMRAPDIARRYPTCRQGDIERLRDPDAVLPGLKRLLAMAEASGLRVRLEVSA